METLDHITSPKPVRTENPHEVNGVIISVPRKDMIILSKVWNSGPEGKSIRVSNKTDDSKTHIAIHPHQNKSAPCWSSLSARYLNYAFYPESKPIFPFYQAVPFGVSSRLARSLK